MVETCRFIELPFLYHPLNSDTVNDETFERETSRVLQIFNKPRKLSYVEAAFVLI